MKIRDDKDMEPAVVDGKCNGTEAGHIIVTILLWRIMNGRVPLRRKFLALMTTMWRSLSLLGLMAEAMVAASTTVLIRGLKSISRSLRAQSGFLPLSHLSWN